ncbi:PepSY domain-containing protein [Roseicyclus sp.]|uniref:PepSY domain-containing protein n=1 Tax=Roseicyclus sp. TaxID=1914329 RepID=UPI003F6CA549
MFRILLASALALPVLAGAANATPPQTSMFLGKDTLTISKGLESLGYEVVSIGVDESGAEAEVRNGEHLYDVTVDMASGLIIRVEYDADLDGDV